MEQPNLTLGWSYDLFNRIFQMDLNEVNEPFETAGGLSEHGDGYNGCE